MNSLSIFFILLISLVQVSSFRFGTLKSNRIIVNKSSSLFMVDEVNEGDNFDSNAIDAEKKLFDMNKRVRLGRSRDQDGKSNIWSIEPAMQVDEEEEESSGSSKNLIIGGAVIGAAIACLPLFNALSSLFPDPSDF